MDRDHALAVIRRRLTTNNIIRVVDGEAKPDPINSIFVVTISISKNSTGRRVKYYMPTNEVGALGLQDITGLVGRVAGNGWNNQTGCYHVTGGDATQPIYNIATELFGHWDAIPVFIPL